MNVDRFRLRRRGAPRFFRPRSGPCGCLEFAGWWARGILWVDGWLTSACDPLQAVAVQVSGVEMELEAPRFSFLRPDLRGFAEATGQILILQVDGIGAESRQLEALYVRHQEGWYRWTLRRGLAIEPDLERYLPQKVQYLKGGVRAALGGFVAGLGAAIPALDAAADPLLERNADLARRLLCDEDPPASAEEPEAAPEPEEEADAEPEPEAAADAEPEPEEAAEEQEAEPEGLVDEELEEGEEAEPEAEEGLEAESEPEAELPPFAADPARPAGLCIDRVLAIDDEAVFVKGWVWDVENAAQGLEMELPSGRSIELLDAVARVERADVAEMYRPAFGDRADGRHGFLGLVGIGEPGAGGHFRFELGLRDREPLQVGAPAWTDDPFLARDEVVIALPEPDAGLIERHLHPTLERLQARCRERVAVARSFAFGEPPSAPEVSVVIPLGERIDLVEHQLAQLGDDPSLGACELIYVLDSPRLEARFETAAFHLSRLYRLPIRGLVLARCAGYAAATNAGAAAARGRLLVLMHSDVFAAAGDWLTTLTEYHGSLRQAGPVGPKLLYEDRSLQHAGLVFSNDSEADGLWSPRHFLKGLPARHPLAEKTRQVAAVSGACLLIERRLFEEVEGLRDAYVAGDFEDADLCLRCLDRGHPSRYLAATELYHLEGQSRSPGPGWRRNPWAHLYNRWLLTRRWGGRLEELSEREQP
jgi:Glycosyltransferase like family 2